MKTPSVLRGLGLVFLCAAALSCGVKRDPVAPLRRLPHPPEFTLRQQGESVFVEGVVRAEHQNGEPIIEAVVTIWRSEQPANMLRVPPAEVFRREAVEATVIIMRSGDIGAFSFEDAHPAGKADTAFFYGVEVRNERGRRSEMTKIARVQPLRFAAAPGGFAAEVTEKAVVLRWDVVEPPPMVESAPAAESAVEPSKPKKKQKEESTSAEMEEAPIEKVEEDGAEAEKSPLPPPEGEEEKVIPWRGARYVVLRSENNGPWTRLTANPSEETTYRDEKFFFGRGYAYRVRSVVEFGSESDDSETVEVRPMDVFPPATPEGFAASVEAVSIRLFWLPNQETDLAGYHVYRSRHGGEFERITDTPIAKIVHVDEDVEVGGRYAYRLTALDHAGNESPATPAVERLVRPETLSP